ncbi:fimbrial protein [Pseudomonas sp. HLT2-19-2]
MNDDYPVFNMGSHYVPRDAPIGSVIGVASRTYQNNYAGNIWCKPGDNLTAWANWSAVTGVTLPAPWVQATVFQTNIPGVGMIVEVSWFALDGWVLVSGNFEFLPYTVRRTAASAFVKGPAVVRFTLVKTSHAVPVGITQLVNSTSAIKFTSGSKNMFSVFVTGSVTRSECSLPNSAPGGQTYINVPMGSVQRREFAGRDSYLVSKDFTIPLTSCIAGSYPTNQSWNFYQNSNVNIKLEGAGGSPIIDASRGIMGLTSDSTAKGVAVQIMRKDGVTPLQLNEDVSLAKVAGTSMNIDLKARYIQTSEGAQGPEPGVANAKAAFTVTYK